MSCKLRISGIHYRELKQYLYPGDGKEAIAIGLCGRLTLKDETIFTVHKIFPIPYSDCIVREELFLDWKTDRIQPILVEAEKNGYSVLKIHSHPSGYSNFSNTDDDSDLKLFESVFGWTLNTKNHLSAIMVPDGRILGRIIDDKLTFHAISSVSIISDDIKRFEQNNDEGLQKREVDIRNIQAFGEGTYQILKKMSVAVIGCSGTGSPVIEQLARLGIGKLVLVDPDVVEEKNLNRIINATQEDAVKRRHKVEVLKNAIMSFGFGTEVTTYSDNLYNNMEAIKTVASCDFIFGCVDTVDGRHLLNLISNYYLTPLLDIGVRLDADGKGGIESIHGTVNYVTPGRASLLKRGLYTPEDLLSAGELRKNPEHYANLEKEKYLKKAKTDSPAVISVNMFYASLAVNDFLARIHPFRIEPNNKYSIQRFVLSDPMYLAEEVEEDKLFIKTIGKGDISPLLGLPELS
ncbi:ThiF family protein [Prolixibacter denitrificans]|uniref:ThiF family protein n=2 Tax=Prolixibacter denitrificans TaxID=1541063 RepID=A0A2P8CHS8_9BACT|nr:ThiF family protein [Prolixibacter denitrificans]GET20669.1 hypothetical protein JCM18694_09150 [Prolixibacter denitrificans]